MNHHYQTLVHDSLQHVTRRHFLRRCSTGLGAIWLGQALNNPTAQAAAPGFSRNASQPLGVMTPSLPAKAKRVIYLHMAGAPSQLELFEYKPELEKLNGKDCPKEYLEGQRFAFIRGVPKMLGPTYPFDRAGESGMWVSDRLPHFKEVVDKVCFIRTMRTEQFNHAPAQLLLHTGNRNLGYPSMGSWVTYGLGTENQNLPGYVVLVSGGKYPSAGKSAWGSGFLPSVYQGVQCRSEGEPVLYLSNPEGITRPIRKQIVETINRVNEQTYREIGDPETMTRIAQYEMAYRMQISATDAMDIMQEPEAVHQLYGTQPGVESFANNCLLARRLAERGVRYIQLYDWGWDSHGAGKSEALNYGFKKKCEDLDKPVTALLKDLEQRGLLEETLVIWGGEFGRTPMRENRGGSEMQFVGRDHHPHAFTVWMAGGGIKEGYSYGETDPIGYSPIQNPVEIRDFHATVLRQLGFEYKKFTFPFQGLDQKLTGVKEAKIINDILA